VGALVADFGDGTGQQVVCSGSLIATSADSPYADAQGQHHAVFLTAAHCLSDPAPVAVWVSFDPVVTDQSTLIPGSFIVNPLFGTNKGGQSDPHDEAVVLLDHDPVPAINPVSLPTAGLLDSLNLKTQTFTAVGYGETRTGKTGGPHAFGFDATRRYATQSFQSLQPEWLTLSMNPSTGNGGTCYGDSGGPHFLGGPGSTSTLEVSITNTGDTVCRSTDKTVRLDTASARQFLGRFVNLPGAVR
jgi:hypothetical protein